MADAAGRPGTRAVYRALLSSRVRSQVQYRTSFVVDVLATVAVSLASVGEVYVVFHNVDSLGGLDGRAALLVLGLSQLGFSLANLVAGNVDTIPTYVRTGNLDVMLLRPEPVLAQVIVSDVRLRRLGSVVVGALTTVAAVAVQDVAWTPARAALLVVAPLAGAVVFAALFVVAGALQFWLVEASEVTNSFTYGSSYASSFSAAVLPLPLRLLFAFVVPAAFTAYLPTLALLGLTGPPGLPAWLGWCTPVVAVIAWLVALAVWRQGIRHYTGAGG